MVFAAHNREGVATSDHMGGCRPLRGAVFVDAAGGLLARRTAQNAREGQISEKLSRWGITRRCVDPTIENLLQMLSSLLYIEHGRL